MRIATEIGTWLVEDNAGNHYLALLTDIDAFANAYRDACYQDTLEGMREKLVQLEDYIEFGFVTRTKNGAFKWQAGDFVTAVTPP